MIRRFFTLLLIVLMLANQGLCLAHVHHGDDCVVPDGHDSRSHFHLGGHVHHHGDHSHEPVGQSHSDHSASAPSSGKCDEVTLSTSAPVGEHDSDAVYCGEQTTIACTGNLSNILPDKHVAEFANFQVVPQHDDSRHLAPSRIQPPSVFAAACPIYLRTLSLRI
ncbi:MAG TPA: hypothetical protein VMM76_05265 [Pirellulaceae bacterium]|nr:hypothetical protein [Pirellulaceae bacterium]